MRAWRADLEPSARHARRRHPRRGARARTPSPRCVQGTAICRSFRARARRRGRQPRRDRWQAGVAPCGAATRRRDRPGSCAQARSRRSRPAAHGDRRASPQRIASAGETLQLISEALPRVAWPPGERSSRAPRLTLEAGARQPARCRAAGGVDRASSRRRDHVRRRDRRRRTARGAAIELAKR